MTEEIDKEILEEFIKETVEELDALDARFIALEKHPKDSETLNSIFRTMHSIKGSASFFNLNHIRTFSHKLENLLDELRKGQRAVTTEIIDILLKGKDGLDKMFARLAEGDLGSTLTPDEEVVLAQVEKTLGEEEEGKPPPQVLFNMVDEYRTAMEQDGLLDRQDVAALFDVIDELREIVLGPVKKTSEVPKLGEILVEQGVVTKQDVIDALGEQKKVGQILVDRGKVTPEAIEQATAEQRKKAEAAVTGKAEPTKPTPQKAGLKKTMRIEEEKIDGFMDLVGELIINSEVFNYLQKKLEVGQDIDKLIMEFKNANLDYNELTLNLQRGLAEVRKVALKGIFQKLPRMVRDLAASIEKKAEIEVSGENLLIDKSLFEQLESPINHMIRNAVDHGIESPEERTGAGKDPVGKVEVSAEEVSGDLVIQIKDDGKGMDANKLKLKAIEKGLITPQEADMMPDKEAYMLVFRPGFSTAAKVTDVSGRGVGMDVVLTAVKEAKGKVDVESEMGRGSTITMTMPMSTTLITISGMVVSVGPEHYIIPMEWVKESFRPDKKQVATVKQKGELVEIREQLYPLVRLSNLFKVTPRHTSPWEGVVMVLEKDEQRCCLMVDEILDETQAVLKDLGSLFRDVKGVLGGAILGDGKIGLVLNVEGIMEGATVVSENLKERA